MAQTPADAIRSATTLAVELLGLDDRGRINVGKLANISMLEDINFVMKGGEVYKQP